MASKLAEVFVEIGGNLNPLRGALGAARSLLGGFAGGLGLVTGGAGLAAIGAGLAKAITAGSDLNETLNKVGVIFGDQAGAVTAGADEMARKFGVVKTEFMDASAEIGNILQGMGGQSKKAAAETSVSLTKLAADASSIFNKSFGEAAKKIDSALRGESEPISEFGIDIQEAAVKQEAFRLGLVKTTRDLTTQEKVTARTSLIIRGLGRAEGDLANTQAGFANSSRAIWGRVTNALASVGQALLPTVEQWTASLNQMLVNGQEWIDANQAQIAGWAEWVSGTFSKAFAEIGVLWRNLGLIFESAGVTLAEWSMNAKVAFDYATEVAGAFASYIAGNWSQILNDAFNLQMNQLRNFATNFGKAWRVMLGLENVEDVNWTPLLDGFKATVEKFPEIAAPIWADLSDQQKAIFDKMFDNEKKHLDGLAQAGAKAAAKAVGAAAGGPVGGPVKKTERAEFSDVESFAKKLQSGIFGDKEAVAKEQLGVQKKQLEVQNNQHKELVKVAKRMAFGVAVP